MSEGNFIPGTFDGIREMVLKFNATISIELFIKYLAWSQLEKNEYESGKDFYEKYESRERTISAIFSNLVSAGNLSISYISDVLSENTWDSVYVNNIESVPLQDKTPCINVTEFADWAHKTGFDCPQIVLDRATVKTGGNVAKKTQDAVSGDSGKKLDKIKKYKGALSEAVEITYNKITEMKKTDLLKPRKIREFIIFMKEMANKKSPYANEEIMEIINFIEIPEEGQCTIKIHDQIKLKGMKEYIDRGCSYANNDVSKRLTKLRKNNSICS